MNSEIRGKDVAALFKRLGLSSHTYRHFPVRLAPATLQPLAAPISGVPGSGGAENGVFRHSHLREAASRLVGSTTPITTIGRAPGLSSGTKIALFSPFGGVGKTTLATSLARVLGARSLRVALVNCNPAFALAPYLSAGSPRLGAISFLHHRSGAPGVPVTVIDASPSTLAGGDDESSTANLVKEAILHADIILFDMPPTVDKACREMLLSMDQIIVPVAPDLRSECSLDVLEALLQSPDADGPELHYVLNRYDHSRSSHRAVRARIEVSLRGRLHPVVVREETSFEEAIESGQAIGDYLPEAEMTQDLNSIADWLQQLHYRGREAASLLTAGGVA